MSRVKTGPKSRARHKKILKMAKGYRMTRSKFYKRAKQAVIRSGERSFAGRKQRKRLLRTIWITRLNAILSQHNIKYSRFISALKKAQIDLNRKVLSEIALNDPQTFEKIIDSTKKFLA